MLKVVIDTNVFVSALLKPGTASAIIEHLKQDRFQFVYPERLIVEIQAIPNKAKLLSRILPEDVEALLELITDKGVLVEPEDVPGVSRDPKDDVFLACAKKAGCSFLISGDEDMLVLKSHGETQIVSSRQFLDAITRKGAQRPPLSARVAIDRARGNPGINAGV